MSDYCVSMGQPGGVEVVATITDGPGAKEIAEVVAKALAEAAPGQRVDLWRGPLGKEPKPHKMFRGETEKVERVRVRQVSK